MMNPKKKPYYSPASSQAGFTLIESLMAILVVTIMMIAISPAIVLSVATRVQTKRLEMGINASRTYIDAVRSGNIFKANGEKAPSPPITAYTTPNEVDVPSGGALDCPEPAQPIGITSTSVPRFFKCETEGTEFYLYCVDNDDTPNGCEADSTKDMIVQGFGISQALNPPTDPEEKAAKGYRLGVRVYRADAFKDSQALKKSVAPDKREAKTVTSGLGDRKAPLVETTTEIVTNQTNYSDLCARLKAFGAETGNVNSACE
jgi:prepilin-type N-terminal cleavage/methylation domain-containing protein